MTGSAVGFWNVAENVFHKPAFVYVSERERLSGGVSVLTKMLQSLFHLYIITLKWKITCAHAFYKKKHLELNFV